MGGVIPHGSSVEVTTCSEADLLAVEGFGHRVVTYLLQVLAIDLCPFVGVWRAVEALHVSSVEGNIACCAGSQVIQVGASSQMENDCDDGGEDGNGDDQLQQCEAMFQNRNPRTAPQSMMNSPLRPASAVLVDGWSHAPSVDVHS